MHFVENKIDNVVLLTIKGNLLVKEDTDKLQERIEDLLSRNEKNIVFDLKNINMISSLGIGGIIRALRSIRAQDGDLRLYDLAERVKKVFEITKVIGLIKIYETRDEAIASFT